MGRKNRYKGKKQLRGRTKGHQLAFGKNGHLAPPPPTEHQGDRGSLSMETRHTAQIVNIGENIRIYPGYGTDKDRSRRSRYFQWDNWEMESQNWTSSQWDYTIVERVTNHAGSDWSCLQYVDGLRAAKKPEKKSAGAKLFPRNSQANNRDLGQLGGQALVLNKKSAASSKQFPAIKNSVSRPKRMPAIDYLISTVDAAIRKGNNDFVVGPLHPQQSDMFVLNLPRKSGFSNVFTLDEYMDALPPCTLPPLPFQEYDEDGYCTAIPVRQPVPEQLPIALPIPETYLDEHQNGATTSLPITYAAFPMTAPMMSQSSLAEYFRRFSGLYPA